jgi:AraC family transcriptional activator of pobA
MQALRSGASVGDAAALSGFTDPAYFARWFRKRTGKTPGESRHG